MSARRCPAGAFIQHSVQFGLAMAVVVLTLWGALGGCREQTTAAIDRNLAPETFLTRAPGDSQTTFYRVQMRWWGTDGDGEVSTFEVAVTDSLPRTEDIVWRRTRRSDSLITFPVEETREVLGHRFYVRSIDNEGKTDETPAWVFFGARNNVPPVVTFLEAMAFGPHGEEKLLTSSNPDAPTDTIPTGWGVRFKWTGSDGDVAYSPDGRVTQVGRVAEFLYRLLPVESEFLGGTVFDTSAAYSGEYFARFLRGSVYAFNVRAIDDGGLSGSGSETRSFVWNMDPVSRISRCVREGGVDSVTCFYVRGVLHFDGDTLALPSPKAGIDSLPAPELTARGFDPDPLDGNTRVAAMEWRSSSGAIFTPWTPFTPGQAIRLTALQTGDYYVMVRSVDALDRVENTPDTLAFYVNFSPRFITQRDDFIQSPMPDQEFRLSQLANGLPCSFWVEDPDETAGEKYRYSFRYDSENEFVYRLNNAVYAFSPYSFDAPLPGGAQFQLRSYTIRVRVEDNMQAGGDGRGTRTAERAVRFRVIAD